MANSKLVKKLILGGVLVYVVRCLARLRKRLLEWHHSKELARKLPTATRPASAENSIDFLGWIEPFLSKGEKLDMYTITKHFTSAQQKDYYQHGNDEGIFCYWTVNPKFTPFALCHIQVWDMGIVRELTSAKLLPKLIKPFDYGILADLTGEQGILCSSHKVWHPQRVVIGKAFTEEYVNKQFPTIQKTVKELIQKFSDLHQKKVSADGFLQLDIIEDMNKATIDVIARFAFNYDIGSINNPDARLRKDFEITVEVIQQRIKNPFLYFSRNWLPTNQNKEFRKRIKSIDFLIKTIMNERTNNQTVGENNDLLDILLESYIDGIEDPSTGAKVKFTEDQIVTNIRTLFFAGHETTASTLCWTFYLLAKHPEASKKLLDEFEANDYELAPTKIENYHYLNAVVLEVLRMYPSAGFGREATEDILLGNGKYLIPKGVTIFCIPYHLQRHPKYYDSPDDFIPERWLQDENDSKGLSLQAQIAKLTRSKSFCPFALGARNCVGRKFALLEMRVFILEMLLAFEIKLPDKMPAGFQEVPFLGVTQCPKNLEIKIRPRK